MTTVTQAAEYIARMFEQGFGDSELKF